MITAAKLFSLLLDEDRDKVITYRGDPIEFVRIDPNFIDLSDDGSIEILDPSKVEAR